MPFVQLYLPERFDNKRIDNISEAVHTSLIDVFAIPPKDYFQVVHSLKKEHLRYPDEYMNIPHTDDLIYVHITARHGRTVEMKQRLYSSIANKIATSTGCSINDVVIVLSENAPENWSFGQGIAQYV
ncbi:MAG TPA: tautomerase family protein [Chitinophaga sp.]|uniref:tautomerase family protein n=1 Tax=Chitinophaga sp. TaxID=1869181 RepID=UPI002BDEFD6B|nr:tautomerase family protein [Chitinophaga sp.]HVI43482.1 tautomerase family protein [Chitinophaga sp.]